MIALEQARSHLETLGMTQAMEVLDSRLDDAAREAAAVPGDACRSARSRGVRSQGALPDHQNTPSASALPGVHWRSSTSASSPR